MGFYRQNARWLGAGALLTLGSSFGQTFFISLFAAEIMEAHGLSDGDWGLVYAAATLTSAATLIFAGPLADRWRPARLALLILVPYAAAACLMASSQALWTLLLAVWLLRFFGQGMMGHVAMTLMARWFDRTRGRAVAAAGLGYSAGEATLPVIAVALAHAVGWRWAWVGVGALLLAVFVPVLARLLAQPRTPAGSVHAVRTPGLAGRHWTRRDAARHWLIWALIPAVLTPSFIGTVLFFQQIHIGEAKGWDPQAMALGYPAYATLTVLALLTAGRMIDRTGAPFLLPLFLLPLGLAMAILPVTGAVWGWILVLCLTGLTQGMANALWGALWAEVYGTDHIGAIRSITVSLMVFSTAAGPGITGILIDAGVPFAAQAPAFAVWCFGLAAALTFVGRRIARERAAGPAAAAT